MNPFFASTLLMGDVLDWSSRASRSCRTTALLLLLGTGVAKAANSVQLGETAGFLLGNAHCCGVPTD